MGGGGRVQLLTQWLAPIWAGVRILPTAIWEDDLMEKNSCDPSHLRVRELWVRVVVCSIIAQMCPTPCQIWVQVSRDNERTCESLFLIIKKKIYIYIYTYNGGNMVGDTQTRLRKLNNDKHFLLKQVYKVYENHVTCTTYESHLLHYTVTCNKFINLMLVNKLKIYTCSWLFWKTKIL